MLIVKPEGLPPAPKTLRNLDITIKIKDLRAFGELKNRWSVGGSPVRSSKLAP